MATLLARFVVSKAKRDVFLVLGCRNCSTSEKKPRKRFYPVSERTGVYPEPLPSEDYEPIYTRDPAPLFFNQEVQKILHAVTGLDLEKVFRRRPMKPKEPEYKFMTDKELAELQEKSIKKALKKLQIPPVLKEREPIESVLAHNPQIQVFDTCRFIFTDVSMNVKNKDRLVVARDPDGTLRHASWNERERMLQIFFPVKGRKFMTPRMFSGEYLEEILDSQEYEYILDRATVQFEPDDPTYIRVASATYEHINKTLLFKKLHSTRHFGAMAFYLAFHRKMDNIVSDMIQQERIDDAVELVRLFQLLHPESQTAQMVTDFSDKTAVIKAYCTHDGTKSSGLELTLQTYIELEKQRKEVEADIKHAHGYVG